MSDNIEFYYDADGKMNVLNKKTNTLFKDCELISIDSIEMTTEPEEISFTYTMDLGESNDI